MKNNHLKKLFDFKQDFKYEVNKESVGLDILKIAMRHLHIDSCDVSESSCEFHDKISDKRFMFLYMLGHGWKEHDRNNEER